MDMSTPSHPSYGQHFQSHDEMKRMLLPSQEAVSTVLAWLKAAGIDSIEEDADWIKVQTTVSVANELLDTKFKWYVSDETKQRRVLRTLEYSVPEDVAQHINLVQPTTRFGHIRVDHTTSWKEVLSPEAAAKVNITDCVSLDSKTFVLVSFSLD